jgi:periplasmic copper chaperone A
MMSAWRAAAGLTFTAGVLAVVAAPASAHVSISPDQAVPGETAHVVFRVPNESDSAATTELEVHFPEEAPIPSIRTGVVPGWTAEVQRTTLDQPIAGHHGEQISEVVSVVTWTADDQESAIQPGEYGEFPAEIGPMPDAEEVFFRTLQTYSDGEISRWIELPANGTEPAFPAPSLRLTGAETATGEPTPDAASAPEDGSSEDSGGATVWLALAGLLAGLAGLALGGVAFIRTRQGAG